MSEILSKVENYVHQLLTVKLSNKILYHNLKHTQRVVKSILELASHTNLSIEERELLLIAGWLHDTGYTEQVENHEEKSVEIAQEFLSKYNFPEEKIKEVCRYIMATCMSHEPQDLQEQIIRDADASHFAKASFEETSKFLRKELNQLEIGTYSNKEWRKINLDVLENKHQYYTDYAKTHWQEGKEANIKKLKKAKSTTKEIEKKEKIKFKLKEESPERTAQTMYRVALRNHLNLSSIADTKANILLSVNAVIISVALSNLIPKLDNPSNYYLVIPTAIFLFFSVVSIVMSVMATRPNVTKGTFTPQDVKDKKVNLLFFGNFHKMSLTDYEEAMQEMVKDKEYLYSSLTKDLYFLGLVLERKYRILRKTYTIFMIGIIISVISFVIAYQLYGNLR